MCGAEGADEVYCLDGCMGYEAYIDEDEFAYRYYTVRRQQGCHDGGSDIPPDRSLASLCSSEELGAQSTRPSVGVDVFVAIPDCVDQPFLVPRRKITFRVILLPFKRVLVSFRPPSCLPACLPACSRAATTSLSSPSPLTVSVAAARTA